MPFSPFDPPYDQLMAAADAVADVRPEVDREPAREVFEESAVLLHNGLVLDGLDAHDARAMVAGLSLDLVEPDPGSAIRARPRCRRRCWEPARPRRGLCQLPHRGRAVPAVSRPAIPAAIAAG